MTLKFKVGEEVRLNSNMDWANIHMDNMLEEGIGSNNIYTTLAKIVARVEGSCIDPGYRGEDNTKYINCYSVDLGSACSYRSIWNIPEEFLLKKGAV